MADRIKGIVVEIGGDTTGLSKALSGVNREISSTQNQLRDVERLLKAGPDQYPAAGTETAAAGIGDLPDQGEAGHAENGGKAGPGAV